MQEAPLASAESARTWISKHARSCPWRLSRFDRIETGLHLTGFLDANRFPPRIRSGAGFRLQTLWCMESNESRAPGTLPSTACFEPPAQEQPNHNITRVISIRRCRCPVPEVAAVRNHPVRGHSPLPLNPRHHPRRCRRRAYRAPHEAYGSDRPRAFGRPRWRRAAFDANRARSPCRLI